MFYLSETMRKSEQNLEKNPKQISGTRLIQMNLLIMIIEHSNGYLYTENIFSLQFFYHNFETRSSSIIQQYFSSKSFNFRIRSIKKRTQLQKYKVFFFNKSRMFNECTLILLSIDLINTRPKLNW
jgi:hypothetical protein